MTSAAPNPESLLAELRFAQSIARHLVSDPHLADEVAQEAILAAIQRPDVQGAGKRAWLSGVIRNLVNNRSRESRRRKEREARYAQDSIDAGMQPPESAAQEALVRGEQRAKIAAAVMALSEPYRTVVVLRYMEELAPPEIATELARPLETVKTQLRRGMARLRDDLDASSGGDGVSWALALLPLVAPRFPILGAPDLAGGESDALPDGPFDGGVPDGAVSDAARTGSGWGRRASASGGKVAASSLPLWLPAAAALLLLGATLVLAPRWLAGRSGMPAPVDVDVAVESMDSGTRGADARGPASGLSASGLSAVAGELDRTAATAEPGTAEGEPARTVGAAEPSRSFTLRVVEEATGRAVPGVEVRYLMSPMPGGPAELDGESEGDSALGPHGQGSPFFYVESPDATMIDQFAGVGPGAVPVPESRRADSDGPEGDRGEAEGDDWFGDIGDVAVTDASGEATLLAPELGDWEFGGPSEWTGEADEGATPALPLAGADSASSSKTAADVPVHLCLFLEATRDGYASVQTCVDLKPGQTIVEVALPAPGHLTLERGDLEPNAHVVVALSDMIMNVRRADLLEVGESSLIVSDLPAGVYRLSARAFLPEFGPEPVFELDEIIVRTDEVKPSTFVLWRDGARDLDVFVEGSSPGIRSLRVRAAGRYANGRFRAVAQVQEGRARLAGLGEQAVRLDVLAAGGVLASTRLRAAAGAGAPREHRIALETGSVTVTAQDGTLKGLDGNAGTGAGSARGDRIDYLVVAAKASDMRSGSTAVASVERAGSSLLHRRGAWDPEEVLSGAEIPNLPPGRYSLWWVHGDRVGRVPIEVGAGPSTVTADFSARESTEVTLRMCQCALPVMSFAIQLESGERLPIELMVPEFLIEDLNESEGSDSREIAMETLQPGPTEARIFLPKGSYVARYRGVELSHVEHSFDVGEAPYSAVLHGPDGGAAVTLAFEEAAPGAEILVASVANRMDRSVKGEVGRGLGAPPSAGHLVALDENRTAVLVLGAGTYRASDEAGRSVTFTLGGKEEQISLRWDQEE